MSEYRWTWGTPDRIGIWMTGGRDPDKHMPAAVSAVRFPENSETGWWCFIMDFPEVLPPRKPVTEVLWVKLPNLGCIDGKFVTNASWARKGETLLSTEENRWIPTNITRSYEE